MNGIHLTRLTTGNYVYIQKPQRKATITVELQSILLYLLIKSHTKEEYTDFVLTKPDINHIQFSKHYSYKRIDIALY